VYIDLLDHLESIESITVDLDMTSLEEAFIKIGFNETGYLKSAESGSKTQEMSSEIQGSTSDTSNTPKMSRRYPYINHDSSDILPGSMSPKDRSFESTPQINKEKIPIPHQQGKNPHPADPTSPHISPLFQPPQSRSSQLNLPLETTPNHPLTTLQRIPS